MTKLGTKDSQSMSNPHQNLFKKIGQIDFALIATKFRLLPGSGTKMGLNLKLSNGKLVHT